MTVAKWLPVAGVTPHGWYHLVRGDVPMMWLEGHDGSTVIDLMGGRSVVDRTKPESVQLAKDGLTGLIPPFRTIDQKGASEDGTTFVDALYDPTEVTADVLCKARTPELLRGVVNTLIGSIDAKRTAELHWWTHQQGHWWAPVRWFRTPPNGFNPAARTTHRLKLILRADNAFWRTDSHGDLFAFTFETSSDPFSYISGSVTATALGPDGRWPLYYTGRGGIVTTDGSKAAWAKDDASTTTREVVAGPFKGFSTTTDNMVVTIQTGSAPELGLPDGGYNDAWARMGRNADGTWNGDGIRLRVGHGVVELARFNRFTKTVMKRVNPWLPPNLFGDTWTLIAGHGDDPRMFKVQRNGLDVFSHKETGTGSALGPAHRGYGWGMQASVRLIGGQAAPATLKKVSCGDNAKATQTGFLTRVNCGDQPMYDDYTVFGPGRFRFWLGPEAGPDDYVEFGPLLENQVARIVTDPRRTDVTDLTSIPPTPQEKTIWQKALDDFLSFAGGGSAPLFDAIRSQWGITPPQGNLFSLLKGRWSDSAAIPPRSPGNPLQPYFVKCSIVDGNAASKIIVSGVPLRRFPL